MARIERQTKVRSEISQKNNFASLYGGASIIEKNAGAINTKSILDDTADNQLILPIVKDRLLFEMKYTFDFNYLCLYYQKQNKYIVISLKEDININGFAIVNTEFYSSNVKDIVVYGSNEYPIEMKEWVQLGEFRLENIYEWQMFPLKTMWARYIRMEFKSHFDNEYYCTITQIRVFGSPILADFKKDFVNQKRDKKIISTNKFATSPATIGEDKSASQPEIISKSNIQNQSQVPSNFSYLFENQTKLDVLKVMQLKQSRQQCKNIDWKNLKELYECSEEEARQQELEFEQSQSIFKMLTMNISEIREFIEQQVKSNQHFTNQIDSYKSSLQQCNLDKKQIQEMNRHQIDQIEDLRKMFYTVSIVVVIFCFVILMMVCFKRKQTVEFDNQFGRR